MCYTRAFVRTCPVRIGVLWLCYFLRRGLCHPYSRSTTWSKSTAISPPSKGISFDIQEGEIFSLLGPNGAGKTTTISVLSTLYAPTERRCHHRRALGLERADGRPPAHRRRAAGPGPLRRPDRPREPVLLGADVRPERQGAQGPHRRGAGADRPARQGQPAGQDLLRRHEAARQHRRRPAAQAAPALHGRADRRHRPAVAPRHPRLGQGAEQAGHDRPLHHPLHGRGPGAVRPGRHHRPRRADRPGHAGRADPPGRRERHARPARRRRRRRRRPGRRGARPCPACCAPR